MHSIIHALHYKRLIFATILGGLLLGCTKHTDAHTKDVVPPTMMFYPDGGPTYHGQPLSYWIIKLKQGNLKEQAEAQVALHTTGETAVPYLVLCLEKEDLMPQMRAYAASALGEIGPPASNAIPALLRMGSYYASRAALMKIRGESIDGLIRALDDPNSEQWVVTAQTVAEFGTNASPAIPGLCRVLQSEKGWAAAYAIGFIHSEPGIAVPALIDAIKHGHKSNAIWALGEFEADASPAIPLLRQQLQDADPMVRQSALLSLRKILPPEQVKTLVPALIQNVNDSDPNLRDIARSMLWKIDPEAAKKTGVK